MPHYGMWKPLLNSWMGSLAWPFFPGYERASLRGQGGRPMPVIDTHEIPVLEKRPGWRGRLFHSPSMTFAHWDFDAGSTIHEHFHEQEEVWHVVAGELEVTI